MTDVTGTLHHSYGGKEFILRLTWGVLAKLQAKHGENFLDRLNAIDGKLPPFGLMLDIVSESLVKGGSDAESAPELADDMLTADPGLIGRLMAAAFPDAAGNVAGRRQEKNA